MSVLKGLGTQSRSVVERVSWIFVVMSGVAIVFMMGATVYEVVARYLFNRPTSWSVEVSSHLLIAPVFLAAAYTLMTGGHVRMEVVAEHLPKRVQLVTSIVTSLMALAFLVVLTWNIGGLFLQAYKGTWRSPGILQIPLSPSYFTMTIGSALFCLAIIVKIFDYFRALVVGKKRAD